MENNGQSYTAPDTGNYDSMPPDAATSEIKQIMSDAGNNQNHPYTDSQSPLHKDFLAHVTQLHEIQASGTDGLNETELAMQEALDGVEERQSNLVSEADAEMEQLEQLGFEFEDIPEDIQQYQLDGLKMQRLNAEGNFQELTPMLSQQLRGLKQSPQIQKMFEEFSTTPDLDTNLKSEITESLIRFIHQANTLKFKGN